jgi:hypothetical protein
MACDPTPPGGGLRDGKGGRKRQRRRLGGVFGVALEEASSCPVGSRDDRLIAELGRIRLPLVERTACELLHEYDKNPSNKGGTVDSAT